MLILAQAVHGPVTLGTTCSPVVTREAETLPYDGRHILEIWGFSSATAHSSVETYVQGLNSHAINPSLRCVHTA